jgi:hypothetical protein
VLAGPGGPVSPEEQYNCGVISEGPPTGAPFLASAQGWWGNVWSGTSMNGLGGVFQFRGAFCSDHEFDGFISPVTNPFFFEDPRALTEVRPIIIYQKSPSDNPLFRGGDIEFYGLQGRVAFNEYLSLTIHKLGLVAIQPDGNLISDDSGFAELQLGPKLTFIRNDRTNTLAAFGVNFEIAAGSDRVFQDTGRGGVTPYISVGQELLPDLHVMGTFGYRFGFDNARSDSLFTSLHLDYGIYRRIYPLIEFNWYHYTSNGNSLPASFEGQDLFNFGSTNIASGDVVTMAAGVRFKITEAIQAGIAYEFPLTEREDLLDYRITADMIFRY